MFWQYGVHREHLITVRMEGSEGMARMEALMQKFRSQPPSQLGGIAVQRVRDYLLGQTMVDGRTEPLDGPKGNMVILDLAEEGNYVAVRPSGTEPKVKFYLFTYRAPQQLADLDEAKAALENRLQALDKDVRQFADTV